jgi:hypothetical protein
VIGAPSITVTPMTSWWAPELDDNQRCVSAPAGCLLAAKSERVRLPNTSPNFRARALKNLAWGTLQLAGVIA